jgi:hypothetical protein
MSRFVSRDATFISNKTFGWAIELLFQSYSSLMQRIVKSYGLILSRTADGALTTEGLVIPSIGTFISVLPFTAVINDSEGRARSIQEAIAKQYDMSGLDDGTYNVFLKYDVTFYEPGTLTLTYGSKEVVGIGTKFTRNTEKNHSLIILDSSEGNNNRYPIHAVFTDGTLQLKNTFIGTTESALRFAIGGYFPDPDFLPPTLQDYRIYEQDYYSIVITTAPKSSDHYWLAQVVKSGSNLTVTDKRTMNLFQLISTDQSASRLMYSKFGLALTIDPDQVPAEQTFRTNTAPLDKNELGIAFPTFNINSLPPKLIVSGYTNRVVYKTAEPVIQSDGSVEFKLKADSEGDANVSPKVDIELIPLNTEGNILPSITQQAIYLKSGVSIPASAIGIENAVTLETNSGDLATMENGSAYPNFTALPKVFALAPSPDVFIQVVEGSETLVAGNVRFQAYISKVIPQPPDDDVYETTIVLIQS